MAKDYETHKEIEGICDFIMEGLRWERRYYTFVNTDWGPYPPCLPDRAYKRDEKFLLLEIKPGNCTSGELQRGLGQMMYLYPYNVLPYLVLSEEQWKKLKGIIKFFKWIGVAIYDAKVPDNLTYLDLIEDKEFLKAHISLRVVQKSARGKSVNLVPFPLKFIDWRELKHLTPTERKKYTRSTERDDTK